MDLLVVLLAALFGYLLGSFSFARLLVQLVAPGEQIHGMTLDIPGSKEIMEVEAVSGTAVAMKLGDKYGGITAILDILKAAIPTLMFRRIYPSEPYFLIAATMALVGHNWPLYYRFRGGRGLSPMIGGFLVVDWLGTLVTSLIAMILGTVVFKSVLIAYSGGVWLMIPWLWVRTRGDPWYVLYAILSNVMFVLAMIPDIQKMIDRKRRGVSGNFAGAMDVTPMGRGIKRMAGWFGLMEKDQASGGKVQAD